MKNVLIIAAHPDDEILGCGGTMRLMTQQGISVHTLFMTGGISSRYSEIDTKVREEMVVIREHASAANSIVGVNSKNVHFLDYQDQRLDTVSHHELVSALRERVSAIQPDAVFTHHPGDYNKDHRVCFEATLYSTRPCDGEFAPRKLYTYEVMSSTERSFGALGSFIPNTYFDISKSIEAKQKALATYLTELKKFPHPRSVEGITALARLRGAEVGYNYAEAFHLVRSLES